MSATQGFRNFSILSDLGQLPPPKSFTEPPPNNVIFLSLTLPFSVFAQKTCYIHECVAFAVEMLNRYCYGCD